MKKSIIYGIGLMCIIVIILIAFFPHYSPKKEKHRDSQTQFGVSTEDVDYELDQKEIHKLNLFTQEDYLEITQPVLYVMDEEKSLELYLLLTDEGKELFSTKKYTPYYFIDIMIRNSKGDYFYQSDEMLWDLQKSYTLPIDIQNLDFDKIDEVIEQLSHNNDDNISLEVTIYSYDLEYVAIYNLDIDLMDGNEE